MIIMTRPVCRRCLQRSPAAGCMLGYRCSKAHGSDWGRHSKYKVLQLLGQGCFGKVAKCKNRVTKEVVAMKVMKKNQNANYFFIEELKMLQRISQLDPDTFNLIKFIEHFEFDGHQCMAFQILDRSVEDQMKKQSKFSLSEIRPMTKQLLVALLGLKTIGVMHTDIKSDNIMLVDQEKHPFKVKLIDFGVAMERVEVKQGMQLQPVAFRSPEVSLGLPLSEAVDMWSLACCLIFWYWKDQGFTCCSQFDQVTRLVSFLGTPSEEMLNEGLLKFPHMSFILPRHLEDIIKNHKVFETGPEFKDREAFCDLLKKMFELDPYKRITPAEALLHPYITMEHLPHGDGYSQAAKDLMSVAETDYFSLQRHNFPVALKLTYPTPLLWGQRRMDRVCLLRASQMWMDGVLPEGRGGGERKHDLV
uniref:Protein kinase domain-containing protein n=1 Tax=Periophthalmus magnuspinnatus TaxID=409849 RepID=A0A3B4A9R2_9GOBI